MGTVNPMAQGYRTGGTDELAAGLEVRHAAVRHCPCCAVHACPWEGREDTFPNRSTLMTAKLYLVYSTCQIHLIPPARTASPAPLPAMLHSKRFACRACTAATHGDEDTLR